MESTLRRETYRQAILAYLDRLPVGEWSLGYPVEVARVLLGLERAPSPYEEGSKAKEIVDEMFAMKKEGILNYYSHKGWFIIGGKNDRRTWGE